MQEILENWTKVQASWIYLEPVFTSQDIAKHMPDEALKFTNLNEIWRNIMTKAVKQNTQALKVFSIPNISENLREALTLGENIHNALNKNLETQRMYFPRFYFLANDELIEIINASADIRRVEPHLFKCFEGKTKQV